MFTVWQLIAWLIKKADSLSPAQQGHSTLLFENGAVKTDSRKNTFDQKEW